MTRVRRLLAAGSFLAIPAVIACTHLWGEPGRGKDLKQIAPNAGRIVRSLDDVDFATSKFAKETVLSYQTAKGETLFALQVKPNLAAATDRPRDVLVLVDTSASKAMGSWEAMKLMTSALAAQAGAKDRFAIWTVNTKTTKITKEFKPAHLLAGALKDLANEYPSGVANLKDALKDSVKAFESDEDRQKLVVLLGDGNSLANPMSNDERTQLCKDLVKNDIAVFTIPFGVRFDSANLHGLTTSTGGAVVRVQPGELKEDTAKRFQATVAVPVLHPKNLKFNDAGIVDVVPAVLPPLRADAPTLVLGRAKDTKELSYTIEGTLNGKNVSVSMVEAVPEVDDNNYFLAGMFKQWQAAKDQPAMTRSDRALAFAFQQNQLTRADLMTQAEWALAEDKLPAAAKLFEQARDINPTDKEAQAGLDVVQKLRDGKLTKKDLQNLLPKGDDSIVRINKDEKNRSNRSAVRIPRDQLVRLAQEDKAAPKADKPQEPAKGDKPLAPAEAGDLLQDAKQRQQIEDDRNKQFVDDAIRRANQIIRTDPNGAKELLKRALDSVRGNPDASDNMRRQLGQRVETALRGVEIQGRVIEKNIEEEQRRIQEAKAKIGSDAQIAAIENQTTQRMRVFRDYMNHGRLEEANKQALFMAEDLRARGLNTPPAVTSGYIMSLNSHNLREVQEVRRRSEHRWLTAMLEVEYSHIPFARHPDEPQVEFPPAAKWRALTELRKDKYESSGFGEETLMRTRQLRDQLTEPKPKFKGYDDPKTTLQEALQDLMDRYDLNFDVNESAFKAAMVNEVLATPIAEKPIPEMRNVALATILRRILARIPMQGDSATYIIRRDTIEITTGLFARAEKVVRVYPVADLVTPIPNAFNQQSVQNSLSIFGSGAGGGFAGGGLGGFGALGGGALGGFGALGGGALGGFGALGGGLGALGGGLGALGGGLGAIGGGGALGALGGGLGQGGGQGGNNLGVGGGALGFGGGQLGQFGNLGGQFGLQGGTQEQLLIGLIRQVIGSPRDWAPIRGVNAIGRNPADTVDDMGDPEGNDLGYFPPARALIVKGSSRVHTRVSSTLLTPPGGPAMGMMPVPRRGGGLVAGAGAQDDPKKDPIKEDKKPAVLADVDAKTMWQDALARGVGDPGLIIATADFLVQYGKFDHAAEFLKANLRQGILVRPWVYQALAQALRETKASPEEIERAEASATDLEPTDARGYLDAAKAMKESNRFERAVAFCKQASMLEPGMPQAYAEAMSYAKLAKDGEAMHWAASNLVGKDWPLSNEDLHSKAAEELKALARTLPNKGDAAKLLETLKKTQERDLYIRMTWEGDADLDLKVQEPNGSICSCLERQTVGGGTLIGDHLSEGNSEAYVAAEAFAGSYKVTVDRVWGQPNGNKAILEITLHKGTPQESTRRVAVDLAKNNSVTVNIDEGRRTSLASVSPIQASEAAERTSTTSHTDNVLRQLRNLADPETTGFERGVRGGVGSSVSTSAAPVQNGARRPNPAADRTAFMSKLASNNGSAEMTEKVELSADGRSMKYSVRPAFETIRPSGSNPVNNPFIPGGSK